MVGLRVEKRRKARRNAGAAGEPSLGGGQDLTRPWKRSRTRDPGLEGASSTPCTLASQGRRIAMRIPPRQIGSLDDGRVGGGEGCWTGLVVIWTGLDVIRKDLQVSWRDFGRDLEGF